MPGIKKKKGKKKETQVVPALERIMGYAGSDMSEEEVGGCQESGCDHAIRANSLASRGNKAGAGLEKCGCACVCMCVHAQA